MDKTTQFLVRATCCAILGWLAGQGTWACVSSVARADDPAITRSDVERITRAQLDVAEQVKRAGERCR
ncbi:MAG TPA: hypothetical protein VD838_09730 [Anaeromyxobacteraceae bacterium]|nr:hypothetical protein [Anaeromyxobacteraceae bacterium]